MALGVAVLTLAAATGEAGEASSRAVAVLDRDGAGELAVGPGFRIAVTGKGGALVERAAKRFEARLACQTGLVLPDPVSPAAKPTLEVRCDGPGKPLRTSGWTRATPSP